MAKVAVDPGICGLKSTIHAVSEDGQACVLSIDSDCEAIRALALEIGTLDGYEVAFKPFAENPVYLAAGRHYKHAACPLPSAVIKAVEVACRLALPKDVAFTIEG
ncbi:MAG TPA: hypothetical protein VMV83_15230 [Rectinemataceae bacterium]|nr:hypothetical protein [Rectinemataceae bacterium]